MPMIFERTWEYRDNPALAESLFRAEFIENTVRRGGNDFDLWAIWVDSPVRALVAGNYCSGYRPSPLRFEQFLMDNRPSDFWDTVFLIDFYRSCWIEELEVPIESTGIFDHKPAVDEILAQSKGMLLWHHQLEMLLQLGGVNRRDARDLRRELGNKSAAGYERVQRMTVGTDYSVWDVMSERLPFDFTCSASLRGGAALFRLLNAGDARHDS